MSYQIAYLAETVPFEGRSLTRGELLAEMIATFREAGHEDPFHAADCWLMGFDRGLSARAEA